MSVPSIAHLRLAAQRLVGPRLPDAAAAVRWLTAMQAQDLKGGLLSVAIRTTRRSLADVEDALATGSVVRSWPMRGTLHLVPAEDLPWMLALTAPRILRGLAARHRQLGLDAGQLDRAGEVAREALTAGRRLRRAALFALWDAAGHDTSGQRGVHTLSHLCRDGLLCLGPLDGGEQVVVLATDWIRAPRRLEGDEALGEWALRYFRSHGPATLADLVRWTGLPVTAARRGLVVARPQLAALDRGGVEFLMDPATPDLLAAHTAEAAGVLLLPGFDELILGYADRTPTLPSQHADAIVPGGNGMFRATVVSDGQVVGTWARTGAGARRRLVATPFGPDESFPPELAARIDEAYAALPA